MHFQSPLPEEFLEKIELIYKESNISEILSSFSESKPLSFRVNTLKTEHGEIEKILKSKGALLTSIPWYKDAYCTSLSVQELTECEEYKEGKIYIQGLSSMIPALVLDPKAEDIILDIAAAPGSKTTQIAALMNDKGKIFANDISRERLFKLKAVLTQLGVTNTETMNIPGEKIWQELPNYFDKVLVDAPCSMEGRFNSNDPKSYNHWSPKKVKELSHRQQYLLWSAVSTTKIGGIVVYSTCTISPEENEEVVNWVLNKSEGKVILEEIKIQGIPALPGLTSWKKKEFNSSLSLTFRIAPQKEYEGFYIAKLRRIS